LAGAAHQTPLGELTGVLQFYFYGKRKGKGREEFFVPLCCDEAYQRLFAAAPTTLQLAAAAEAIAALRAQSLQS